MNGKAVTMIILSTQNLKKSFSDRVLFDRVSFEIDEKDKVGLVGANGTGKTTLFKLIIGQDESDSGTIIKSQKARIGYMEQQICRNDHNSMMDEVLTVFSHLMEMERELTDIARQIERGEGNLDKLVKRQMLLNEQFQREGGLTYRSRGRSALLGLGFTEEDLQKPIGKLSGGQKSKVSLAKLLVSESNLLLLDEPTNHLDVTAIQWLEEFLRDYKGAALIISHDRYFLDRVTTRTFELESKRLACYKGSYSDYLKQKEKQREELEHQYESQIREIHRIEGIIEQQRSWNRERNIKTAESKQKMLDRLKEELVIPEKEEKGIHFDFSIDAVGGNDVLLCDGLSKSFGSQQLFRDVEIHIQRGERVFLLGANGCGKTTLFKIIHGGLAPDSGNVRLGSRITTGYFDQTQSLLHPEKTVLDEVWDDYVDLNQTTIRNALAAFLFKGEDVYKRIADLSGGERARVAILKLMLSRSNFLLLDEPTNHLDIKSCEALEDALSGYQGTLFIISHDRYFINKTADRILFLDENGITEYRGDYSYYLERMAAMQEKKTAAIPVKSKVNDYKLKKERQSELRRLNGRITRCEAQIEELDGKIKQLEESLQLPENVSDYQKILEITSLLEETRIQQQSLTEEWESLSEKLFSLEEEEALSIDTL